MIGKNLKYYRLQNNMTKKKIAEKAGISSMAVTHYESNERMPEPAILKKLAQVLSVSVMDLTASRNENLQFYRLCFDRIVLRQIYDCGRFSRS